MSSLREIKQEWDRPVDMEWNKVLKRWQPMVFDDDDDDDYSSMDDDTAAAAAAAAGSYPLSVSSSSSVTMVGGGDENNGDDNGAIDLRRCMGRCGKCAGCRKEDCGECVKCKAMKKFGGTRSTGACIHRPCDKNNRPAAATAAAAGGDDDPNSAVVPVPTMIPQVGDRVYCLWPDTGTWFWGNVVKEFQHYRKTKYSVNFDDGDQRTYVPMEEIYVEEEYYRLFPNEKKKKRQQQKKKRKTSNGAVSLSSASTASSLPAGGSPAEPPFPFDLPRGGATKKTKKKNHRHQQQAPNSGDLTGEAAVVAHALKPAAVATATRHHQHRFGGRGGKCKTASFDSTLDVGSRVWARFSGNNGFYWGHITKKTGEGILTKYSVLFMDGDTEDNIRCEYVLSEAEYFGHPDLNSTDDSCQECALCLQKDCGTCEACDTNRRSTQTTKYCCLFKTCMAFDIDRKAQTIPGLPEWKFYFDDERSLSSKSTPLHPKLAGLRILPPPGTSSKIYGSLDAAVKKKVLDDAMATNAAQQLYEKWLGLRIRVPVNNHELIGKRFCRQWLDVSGRPKALFGEIVSCERHYFEGELFSFKIEYDEDCLSLINSARGFDAPAIEFEEVSEALAWGGYVLFQEKAAKASSQLRADQPCPLKWLLPDMIHRTLLPPDVASNEKQRPKLSIVFRGFRLVFEARQSDIPNAGLGVFLTCFSTSMILHNQSQEFVLPAGELLDIGLYAPLRQGDLKDGGAHVIKNFIQHGATEVYSFDISGPDNGKKYFDITDDLTSELHEEAWQNVPSFVNETDGLKTPTIHAMHDPHGSVHYLLGHQPDHVVPFRIPLGKTIETKIDYGSTYERVRVRKKYSRLNDAERFNVEKSILIDDSETLSDINEWSVVEVEESIAFLASVQFKQASDTVGRALLVATLLLRRLFEVEKEFSKMSRAKLAAVDSYCDNGYSTMAETKVVERAIAVVLQLLGLWDNKDQALEAFFQSSEAFVYYLAHAVATSVATVKKLNGGEMRNKIQALCGNTPSNQRRAQQPLSQSGGAGGGGGGRDGGLRDKVLAFIQAHENANDDGASVPECVQNLQFTSGYSEAAVRKMVDDLESEGHIYSTVDEDHFMLACGDEGGLRNKVLAFIRANDNGNDWGASVPECVQNLQLTSGYSEAAVRKMVDELAYEGLIYSTIDEDHFLFAS